MSNTYGLATVTRVVRVDDDPHHGYLYEAIYENGYETSGTLWPDGVISGYQIDERRDRSLMPLEYVYKVGKDFDWSKYREDVSAQKKIANVFVTQFEKFRSEGRGLYITSETRGSGKTMLACCLANEVLKKHDLSVKFINVTDYIELVKQKDDWSREKRDSIMDAGLLILDDVGAQVENKEWISTALFRLIDSRYRNHYPTIFTSNVRMDELKTDGRISDRIYAVSVPVVLPEVAVRKQLADAFTKDFLNQVMKQAEKSE